MLSEAFEMHSFLQVFFLPGSNELIENDHLPSINNKPNIVILCQMENAHFSNDLKRIVP